MPTCWVRLLTFALHSDHLRAVGGSGGTMNTAGSRKCSSRFMPTASARGNCALKTEASPSDPCDVNFSVRLFSVTVRTMFSGTPSGHRRLDLQGHAYPCADEAGEVGDDFLGDPPASAASTSLRRDRPCRDTASVADLAGAVGRSDWAIAWAVGRSTSSAAVPVTISAATDDRRAAVWSACC